MERFRLDDEVIESGLAHVAEIRKRLRETALGTAEPGSQLPVDDSSRPHEVQPDQTSSHRLVVRVDLLQRRLDDLGRRVTAIEIERDSILSELVELREEGEHRVQSTRAERDRLRGS